MTENAYTVEPTRVGRDHWKKWEAKTAVVFAGTVNDTMGRPGVRVVNLSTHKNDRGMLLTTATAVVRQGGSEQHVFGLAGGGDYSATVIKEPCARVGEKEIRDQHRRAVEKIPEIVAEVVAHYARAEAPDLVTTGEV